jgi:hypothetical protein
VKRFESRAQSAQLQCLCDQYADALCGGDIFEMKTISGDMVKQVRAAIGQLYHYMFIHRNVPGYGLPRLYAVFDKEIASDLVQHLVERARIGVIWTIGNQFDADPETRARLPWLFS